MGWEGEKERGRDREGGKEERSEGGRRMRKGEGETEWGRRGEVTRGSKEEGGSLIHKDIGNV